MKKLVKITLNAKALLIVGLLFVSSLLSGQNYTNVDSLIRSAEGVSNSSIRIREFQEILVKSKIENNYLGEEKILKKIIEEYKSIGIREEVYRYLLKLQFLYEDLDKVESLVKTRIEIARILYDLKLYDKTNTYLLEAEKTFHKFDNSQLKRICFEYLGEAASENKQHNQAIIWFNKALNQAKKNSNTQEINKYYNRLGSEYILSNKIEEGIRFYKNILTQMGFNEKNSVKGIMHNNLGVLYVKSKNFEQAKNHLELAIDLIPSNQSYRSILIRTHINLSLVLHNEGNSDQALSELDIALQMAETDKNNGLIAEIYYNISNLYYLISDSYNALNYIDNSIEFSNRAQNSKQLASSLLFKSKIYASLNNYELERDYKSEYYQIENKIKIEKEKTENSLIASRISFEAIEKEILLERKQWADDIAKIEREKAEDEARNARESKLLRDQAIIETQNEIAKNKLIEAEKNAALNKSKQDSLTAVNALVQEENAKQKSIADSIAAVLAIQKQKIAQKEVESANKLLGRSQLIGILLAIIVLLVVIAVIYQRNINRQLASEKAKSEELLLNILPKAVADELKERHTVSPKKFEKVSVVFTDFAGFTGIVENMSGEDLISELDTFFNAFDKIIEKHGLEKIKTIGDSYMCAGGVPIPNKTNPVDAVKAGLDIVAFVDERIRQKQKQGLPYWTIRVGVNTGPVISGIVGSKKFAYDIWGDTVNTASRIESNGLEGKVNISYSTYLEVKDHFNCVSRGKISAKSKGDVEMFYVLPSEK